MPPWSAIAISTDASLKSASAPKLKKGLTPIVCSSATSGASALALVSAAIFVSSGPSGAAPFVLIAVSSMHEA